MLRIVWQGKIYESKTYEELLKKFAKDQWFGGLEDFAKRIHKFYGVELILDPPEAMFRQLENLGELTITEIRA